MGLLKALRNWLFPPEPEPKLPPSWPARFPSEEQNFLFTLARAEFPMLPWDQRESGATYYAEDGFEIALDSYGRQRIIICVIEGDDSQHTRPVRWFRELSIEEGHYVISDGFQHEKYLGTPARWAGDTLRDARRAQLDMIPTVFERLANAAEGEDR